MCGIAGIVHLDGAPIIPQRDLVALTAISAQIGHRGPDDEQIYVAGNVAILFRRLSIIDIEGGRQPIFSEDDLTVVFANGEIYNHLELRSRLRHRHTFRSHSDCEVIVHGYEEKGLDIVHDLNGMYAIILLDRLRKRLFMIRDRLGVKPLFYCQAGNLLLFASELKGILSHPDAPREFNWQEAMAYRTLLRYPQPSRSPPSFFHNINHLPGGSLLEVELESGRYGTRRYWTPTGLPAEKPKSRSTYEFVHAYRSLLGSAVELQLMADVEVGLSLSGGIDSAAIACFSAKHRKVDTFTVFSQSTLANGDAPSARRVANLLQLPNYQAFFDWREFCPTPDLWRKIVWHVEHPAAGPEQIYKYLLYGYAKKKIPDMKVMLSGTGSDEFNGGYSKAVFNFGESSWQNFLRVIDTMRRSAVAFWSKSASVYDTLSFNDHNLIRHTDEGVQHCGMTRDHPWQFYLDMYLFMLQAYQLWHEDRTTAAHALENRVPFLDHRIVELAFSVPLDLCEDLFWDKSILRDALTGMLPEDLRCRPKVPFFIGEDERYTRRMTYNLLRARHGELVEEALAGAEESGLLDADVMRALVEHVPDDPEFTSVDLLLDLVNMGLLARMAKELPDFSSVPEPDLPTITEANDTAWMCQLAVDVTRRTDALTEQSVLCFCDGIRVVRAECGDPEVLGSDAYYILSGDELKFALEPGLEHWVAFLRLIDGRRSVSDILGQAHLAKAAIWKHLEEALEYKVLEIVA